jgi:hypothetical protein
MDDMNANHHQMLLPAFLLRSNTTQGRGDNIKSEHQKA